MTDSKKINPEISIVNEKNQLKKIENNVQTMKNRVELLRQQLQKEKDAIKKHKQLTKQAIQKKVEVNRINQWKQKDNSQESQKIQLLRKRNKEIRLSHEKEMEDIQKAIYLVKLDDARQVKNISMEHRKKIEEMENLFLESQKERKKKIVEESQLSKQRYMKYWKEKLASIYTEQAQSIVNVSKQKEESKKQLDQLEQEELKLMEQINKYHSQGVESKKEYLAALSLPVKQVAEAMQNQQINANSSGVIQRRQSVNLNRSSLQQPQKQSIRYAESGSKLPNVHVNQDKLKIILQQLKKIDRKSVIHTSR